MSDEICVDSCDIKVSNLPEAVLAALPLGSSMAVVIHDPDAKVSGILHFILPQYQVDRDSALKNPALFADTGIPQLFLRAYKLGAVKERIRCYLVGGGDVIQAANFYEPGKENLEAAIDVLSKNSVQVAETWVSGIASRGVKIENSTGKITILTGSEQEVAA